jgi:hypothetical protein
MFALKRNCIKEQYVSHLGIFLRACVTENVSYCTVADKMTNAFC